MNVLKSYKDTIVLVAAMIVGGVIGFFWGPDAAVVDPIANVYLNLLFCCVVPMIAISLINSISKMSDMKRLGKIILVMAITFVCTQVIATAFTGIGCLIFDPGEGAEAALAGATEVVEEAATAEGGPLSFFDLFTTGDFVNLLSRDNLMALVVFSLLTGFALASINERAPQLVQIVDQLNDLIMRLVGMVMKLTPIGLGFFFCSMVGQYGAQVTGSMVRAVVFVFAASVVYFFAANTLYSWIGDGARGVRSFWANAATPALTALGTCSSAATMPASYQACKRIGVSSEISDLVIPIGTNMHKEGTCFVVASTCCFALSMYGINFADPTNFITAMGVTLLCSVIAGAIPNGGNVSVLMIASVFGLPATSVAIMIVYNTLIDAPTTAINAVSHISSGMIVDRFVNGRPAGANEDAGAERGL
ncbi:dicarboxylate/amino acid:cation symporter [Thermophilibacter sp.]